MHEAGFTEKIIEVILADLKKQEGEPKNIRVRVGEMFHLHKDSVLFHYQMRTQSTALERIPIDFEEVPVEVLCRACGQRGPVEDHHLLMCSSCLSRNVEVVQGNTITTQIES